MLTGDIHSFWVNDLANAAGRAVGVELVASSIATSTYDKSAVLPLNPGTIFHDGVHNGYVRCELSRERLRADIVTIADRADPRSGGKRRRDLRNTLRRSARPPHQRHLTGARPNRPQQNQREREPSRDPAVSA